LGFSFHRTKRQRHPEIRHTRGPIPDEGFKIWTNIPRAAIAAFLGAVFFVFTSIGFAGDIMGMGREPVPRFIASVLLSGVFAIFYAASGITLRRKFWIAFFPLFALQYFLSYLLGNIYPEMPQPAKMTASQLNALSGRMSFDATAIIIAVSLGYTGFAYVSFSGGRRYARARMEMAFLEGEMAAAREVQRVMLPEHGESFPGFTIDSIYKPAREVGGDFFQILPTAEGLLIVFGDVAGKGLPAAMLVSMLVGSIRATAEETSDASLILQKLHDRLLGRNSGSFCTAVVARIAHDGAVTIANAGNPAPYLDGVEIDLPGALPLGIPGAGDYESIAFHLDPGSRLTFLSDGIVEAMNPKGELFGFARATAISTQSASAIAQAAVDFGQEDDITVVTLQRQAAS
jgi:hypothetical protein